MVRCADRCFVALVVVVLSGSAARGAENPSFGVDLVGTRTVYTATPVVSTVSGFKPHINFPWITRRYDGSLVSSWSVGQTHGSGVFGLGAVSSDNGDTWNTPSSTYPFIPPITQINAPLQTSRGFTIYLSSTTPQTNWTNSLYTSLNGGLTWSSGIATFNTGSTGYTMMYQNSGDVVSDGSALLITAYGQKSASSSLESVLFASTDGGLNWARRSAIAEYTPSTAIGMGSEGPSESDIVQLNNGSLLAVYRTGQPFPNPDVNSTTPSIGFSLSADHGATWSTPKMLGVGGAFPHLNKLDDGSVAMTFGRAGVKVMIVDPTGTRWSYPTTIYSQSTCGYVRMQRRSDGKYVLAYDESSFYPPGYNSNPPSGYVYGNDQIAYTKTAILDVKPKPSFDYYNWALEYHGDVAPTALSTPWAVSSNGAVKSYLWMEQGQDYIRTDSGANDGQSRSLYYALSGSGSTQWSQMDFAAGVVSEFRARVARAGTPEGAANLIFGDATHGYVSVELSDNGVDLEGLGGDAAQVNYFSSAHPLYSPFDWHDYRLIVAPDPASGSILAKLYLDADHVHPILVHSLNATVSDQLRFGDQTGTNNGAMDLDYLRFATRLNQWSTDANGNWSNSANWSSGSVPAGASATAYLLDSIAAPRTVILDGPVTLGNLIFDNPNSYTITGPGTLTFQGGGITLVNGSHSLLAPLSITAPVSIRGNGTLSLGDVSDSSTLSIQTSVSANSLTGTGTLSIASATTFSASRIRQRGLVNAGTLRLDPASGGPNEATMVLDYSGTSPLNMVRDQIRSGYNAGAWTGTGITSSAAGATHAIGYADNSVLHLTTFAGQPVDATSILVKLTHLGDANLDGQVDVTDLGAVATNWQTSGVWTGGDFNYDGFIDITDLGALATNWQAGVSFSDALALMRLGEAASVPEPDAAGALLAVMALIAGSARITGGYRDD